MKKITAVVMCSGLSRRMGENKLSIPFNGKKMYQHTLDTVIKSGFYRVNVVTSYDEIAKKYQGLYDRVDVIINKNNAEGISSSIRLGVENSGECDGLMFFTADQPYLDISTINALTDAFIKTDKIVIPFYNGIPRNPVIFPARYKAHLLTLRGDEGGKRIYRRFLDDSYEVLFENELPFIDIDTRDDLEKLKKQMNI